MSVVTVYLPGDEPEVQLSPRRRRNPARLAARMAMSGLAEDMHPNYGPALRYTDPVAHADLVTSMCDQRAALCVAIGVPLEHIDRNGYNTARSASREGAQR